MKILKLALLLLIMPVFLSAQSKWEIGAQIGFWGYQGDLNPNIYMDFNKIKPGYGLFIRKNLSPAFSLRAQYAGGTTSGDDRNFDQERIDRGFSYTSDISEISLLLEWELFGKKRYTDGVFKKIFSPYLFAGAGYVFNSPTTNYNEALTTWDPAKIAKDKAANNDGSSFTVPFGVGIKMDLSEKWALGLEYGFRPVFNDYFDGVSISGDPSNNDWYSMLGLNISYRFLANDFDKDGISDVKDACPKVAGLPQFNGCPDTDLDGITDLSDACPTIPGKAELNGCPDMDSDGIADKDDMCPDVPGTTEMHGCPDADGDGITDKEDACPNEKGISRFKGCPDTDNDGIADKEDKCPTEKGTLANGGCPDTDNDGIVDKDDKCPTVVGTRSNFGCPELKKEDREAIELAVKSIQFENKSDELKPVSLPILDQVADVLIHYPNYKVNISGHTDDKGKDEDNLILSQKRAKKCVDYLISKGIDSKRLFSFGYGETKPIASNKTDAGKAKNRRVEFELIPGQ